METQVDELLDNPRFADPNDPAFEHIRNQPFRDMLRKAMKLEIASQKGDWSIPSQADAMEMVGNLAHRPAGFMDQEPDEPEVKVLWEAVYAARQSEEVQVVAETEDPSLNPAPPPDGSTTRSSPAAWRQMGTRNLMPKAKNTNFPTDGIMIDGSPAPPPPEPADPWAVPEKPGNVVEVGGTVVLGEPPKE
jgi:hypothetical protein